MAPFPLDELRRDPATLAARGVYIGTSPALVFALLGRIP
jgi:hypothetical protein